MTQGIITTQQTRVYFAVNDSGGTIHKIACSTGVNVPGGTATEINATCLDSTFMQFVRGLQDLGSATVPFNTIHRSAAYQALVDLNATGVEVPWMIVFSDQAGAPTDEDSDGMLVSPGATSVRFWAYVSQLGFDVALDEIIRGTLTLRLSSRDGQEGLVWDLPTADLA